MKLEKISVIKGIIHCESGLHIGGSSDEIEIGGVDLPVIKNPVTREPYIPGSSLKGKMRSGMEKSTGQFDTARGEPCGCGNCMVCRVFGAHKNSRSQMGPTRILVRDGHLTEKSRQLFEQIMMEKGLSYIEKKTENVINRKTGTAEHPRTMERVPAEAEFTLELVIQFFNMDKGIEEGIIGFVKDALCLVEKTYLGGFGSRGSGQVKFKDLALDGQPFTLCS